MTHALALKGYPEFNADQPRDASGRWSGGGGNRLGPATRDMLARQGSGRRMKDTKRRLAAAKKELDGLRADARKAVKARDSNALARVGMDLSRLRFKIPVSDYNAKPIKEGRDLDRKVGQLTIWMDKQYQRHRADFDRRSLELSRSRQVGDIIDRMYGRKPMKRLTKEAGIPVKLLEELGRTLTGMLGKKDPKHARNLGVLSRRLTALSKGRDGPGSDLLASAANMASVVEAMYGAVAKGRPEYRDDQSRDERGRWSVGGSVSGPGGARREVGSVGSKPLSSTVREAGKAAGDKTRAALDSLKNSKTVEDVRKAGVEVKQATSGVLDWVKDRLGDIFTHTDEDTKWQWIETALAAAVTVAVIAAIYFGWNPFPAPKDPDWFQWLWQRLPNPGGWF